MTVRISQSSWPSLVSFTLLIAAAVAPLSAQTVGWPNEKQHSGSFYSKSKAPAPWLVSVGKHWMKYLADDAPLHQVSIPGTHDSGARFGGIAAECQSWTIEDQLKAGIRYFDIRCRRSGDAFAIHHGAFYQKQSFGDVLKTMQTFLKAHPEQVVLMAVQEEHKAAKGSAEFPTIWKSYKAKHPDLFLKSPGSQVTVGEARGKIVVIRNSGWIPTSDGLTLDGGNTITQNFYKVFAFLHKKTKDNDWATLPSKKALVVDCLNKASGGASKWFLNYLSGSTGMAPHDVARATNRTAYEHIEGLKGKPLGVVIMDYPGEQLICRIIDSNLGRVTDSKYKMVKDGWIVLRKGAYNVEFDVSWHVDGQRAASTYRNPKSQKVALPWNATNIQVAVRPGRLKGFKIKYEKTIKTLSPQFGQTVRATGTSLLESAKLE